MVKKRIRLSIKLAAFTALMVVVSMLSSFYLAGGEKINGSSSWILVFSFVSFGVGLLYTLFLDRIITVPIHTLVTYTSEMVEDDFRHPAPRLSNDEIGSLSESIDELRQSVVVQRRSLQELNEQLDAKVEERTRELEQAMTDLRAAQGELLKAEKLASVGRLAGGIAHEINNPAAIILTRTGLLLASSEEASLSDDLIDALKVIDRQVSRISRITHDLLVFSRMTPMKVVPVDVCEILTWTWSLYAPRLRASSIHLSGDIPSSVIVLGDPEALEEVFGNLVKNAMDAMEDTGGTLARSLEILSDRVIIRLIDTGPGIPPDILPRIFDPFFTTKTIGKGTGLGLAISYGILQDLGGTVEARNHPAGGSEFAVTLRRPDSRMHGDLPSQGQQREDTHSGL